MTNYIRYTHTDDGMDARGIGYAMMVGFDTEKEYDFSKVAHYGPIAWTYNGDGAIDIDDIKKEIESQWENDNEIGISPYCYNYLSGEEVSNCFDPEEIVNSAGGWDSDELFTWLFDRCECMQDISAIKTKNGCIVFDRNLLVRNEEWSNLK